MMKIAKILNKQQRILEKFEKMRINNIELYKYIGEVKNNSEWVGKKKRNR